LLNGGAAWAAVKEITIDIGKIAEPLSPDAIGGPS
jgi:hypothetical protein